jgi:hypothetical protein
LLHEAGGVEFVGVGVVLVVECCGAVIIIVRVDCDSMELGLFDPYPKISGGRILLSLVDCCCCAMIARRWNKEVGFV